LNITNHQKNWRIEELASSSVYIYVYIYIYYQFKFS
jgi:hypothetical protein